MQIMSIQIKHFRNIRDTITLYPSCSDEENVTLIRGEEWSAFNGDITTIYEACRWCIEGEDALQKGGCLLLNPEVADKLSDGESKCVQGEMTLSNQEVEYRILRTMNHRGCGNLVQSEDLSTARVTCRGVDGKQKELSPPAAVQFLEDLAKDPSIKFYHIEDLKQKRCFESGQVLLFATRYEMRGLEETIEKKSWDWDQEELFARIAKIYSIRTSICYSIGSAWEDTAFPVRNILPDMEGLPRFSLPGRLVLEDFFNDHVVDIVRSSSRYRSLGVDFPGSMILYGPPGSGKTYAVEQIGEFLGWPRYYIDCGTVGSSYIHETGVKINQIFDQAAENAPSIIVIDEMDAFLSSRRSSLQDDMHHTEELAEFLRRIPKASKEHVLVIGMTNRLDNIDPAFLRRGRFDHIIEVGMPMQGEIIAALWELLSELPTDDNIDLFSLSEALDGRPMSDLAFVVKEAGRLSAKAGRDTIDKTSLWEAIHSLPPAEKAAQKIGFIA